MPLAPPGPLMLALPELLPLTWKHNVAELSRRQASRLVRRFAPGSRLPAAGWELCLVREDSGSMTSLLYLVNQADPRNLEFILGMTPAKTPYFLRLDWRSKPLEIGTCP